MTNLTFLNFFTDNPWIFIIIGAVLIVIVVLFLLIFLKKKDKKGLKIDDEFISNLLSLLGEAENIIDVNVDNGRLKISVNDLDKVNLEGIKAVATSGVFVTGNIIKTLFRLDSETIKKALDARL